MRILALPALGRSLLSFFASVSNVCCSLFNILRLRRCRVGLKWTLKKHQGFLLDSIVRNCIFGASVRGGTQARFTPIGKVVFLGPGTLPALFTCFIDMSLRFFICWLHHHQKHEKYEDSGFAGAGPLFRFILYECFQRLLQFFHIFSPVQLV